MIKTKQGFYSFITFIVFACFVVSISALAQQTTEQHVIRLKAGPIIPAANAGKWIDSMSRISFVKEPVQVLIHFEDIPTQEQRKLLQLSGITLHDYLPENTFFAMVQFPVNTELLASVPIQSIINTQPEWKADDYIWKKVARKTGAIEVLVSFCPGIDAAAVKQFVGQIGGQVDPGPMEKYGSYKVIVAASKVRALSAWYGVRYISPVAPIVPLDIDCMPAVKGNIARAAPAYGGYGLMGDSVVVGVGDESAGIYHADIKDRVINFNPAPDAHHGGFVNAVVGGAANVDPLAWSMTPHVTLVDHFFDEILPATGPMLHDYNMTITNNSYEIIAGDCSYEGTYDAYSQLLDTLAIEFPVVQHVFASGNDGWYTCGAYPFGFETVGGGYQPAKNNIVVGGMTDTFYQASDESRGPVKDGRLKPEIVATSWGVYSAINIDGYEWSAGTSFASPQIASGLAALTQRYKQLNSGAQPRADLLKAVLLNGTTDIGNTGPDYTYGFGAMNMYRSLQMLDKGHYISSTINNGGNQTFNLTVPANTGQVKVMLYWNDVEGSPSAAIELVNDLDLTVTDPASAQHLPLVLDPTPANVNIPATEKADHINNVEQVTINNPAAGNYSVTIKGFNIPQGPQQFVVAYDFLPDTINLTYPLGGEQLSDSGDTRFFWDAVSDTNKFTVLFSPDKGTTWQLISDSISPYTRYIDFSPAGINSSECLVQLKRNNTTDVVTSGKFTLNKQPVVRLDSAQCPGYVNIHWAPIPNATGYLLLKKVGGYMQVVDSVTDTAYSYSNMPLDTKSYVAVQPKINGVPGYRSVAASTVANTGNCTLPVSSGDLMIDSIVGPSSGRMYTSSQLSPGAPVKVRLRDLYSSACNNYTLSYQVNGGSWQTFTSFVAIPANGVATITTPMVSFPDTGSYTITVAVSNLALPDPQPANDTVSFTIKNLPNDTVSLATPFFDGFENMVKFSVGHDSIGLSPNNHWDYFNTNDSGRMRSFVFDNILITGTRSISLDEDRSVPSGSNNTFVGTFNLAKYDTATTEIRVDFDYVLHGMPKTPAGNIVTARAADTAALVPFYTYDLNAYPGTVNHVLSLSLTDAVRFSKHNFSPSTQVSFGQNDTSLIAAANYGNGMTLDNFRMYTVSNDADLISIVSPLPTNCGLPSSTPLIIKVHNGVNYTLHNVQLYYNMDSGTVYTGVIDSIGAKDTVTYTFSQQLNITPSSTHMLNVWLTEAGDSYSFNDSILNYHFRNSVIISTYPYLENFESGNGGYFSGGINNSWQYGTPASPIINKAASGTKAWKTNLTGHYNNLETSYLYSPCFDISQLVNPMLSFSTALDIENCGTTLCDAAYIEYSFDGIVWSKLGSAGQGTNWYDSTFNVWNPEGFTRWHVASIPLPQPPVGETIHFRFVMNSDPAANYEGIAVDDIHIYDLAYPILPAIGITTVSQNISGNSWIDYLQTNQLLASVQPNNQAINNAAVTLYAHDTLNNPGATQYVFPRSYTLKAPQAPTDSIQVRLYLLDSDVVNVLNDTTCPSCSPVKDAYSLGITQYDNHNNPAAENGSLADDTGGVFTFYPYRPFGPVITWVPYDKGYYAELTVKPFSEFWFNDGGPTGTFPIGTDYLNFIAFKNGQNVTTYWYSLIDTAVHAYTLERSTDGINFVPVIDTTATHSNPGEYTYTDPVNVTSSTVLYYRLQWTMTGGSTTYYSPVRKVDFSDAANNLITFNAQIIGYHSVLASWSSYIDGMTDHYILDRAIDNGAYTNIDNTPSQRHYGQQYSFVDNPAVTIPDNTLVSYRLTAVLDNGTDIILPIRTVYWENGNTLVNVYPNPNYDGNVTISWHADSGTVMHVNIFDELGRSKYQATATAAQWNNTTTFHTFTHAKGVYFARFDIGGKRYTAKLLYE